MWAPALESGMSAPFSWIRPEPWGIHVVPADAWVDPSRAVERALVTHGHADHLHLEIALDDDMPFTTIALHIIFPAEEAAT